MKKNLLIVDPQNSFVKPDGELPVPGADKDMDRLAVYIDKSVSGVVEPFNQIFVTLDIHPFIHIAHPAMWLDEDGKHPDPYKLISLEAVESGKYRNIYGDYFPEQNFGPIDYLKAVGSFVLWPPHCLQGTSGANVWGRLQESLIGWQLATGKNVHYTMKGLNPFTEQFSVFKAAYPIRNDPTTQYNEDLADKLMLVSIFEEELIPDEKIDQLEIAREAESHYIKDSVLDFLNDPVCYAENAEKLVLLTDCMSCVKGYENLGEELIGLATDRGVRTTTTAKETIR